MPVVEGVSHSSLKNSFLISFYDTKVQPAYGIFASVPKVVTVKKCCIAQRGPISLALRTAFF